MLSVQIILIFKIILNYEVIFSEHNIRGDSLEGETLPWLAHVLSFSFLLDLCVGLNVCIFDNGSILYRLCVCVCVCVSVCLHLVSLQPYL